jgi:hypothetical protein
MAKALPITQQADAEAEAFLERTLAECEHAAGRVKDLLRLADALIAVLPLDRRIAYAARTAAFRAIARPGRGSGAVNDNIIAIVTEKEQVTAADVRNALMHKGMAVDQKQINNSLDYLARSGRLKRIGRGRYEIAGYGVGIEWVGEYE